MRLSSQGRVRVVGESHYQPAIRALAGGRVTTDFDDAVQCVAFLIPEPENPHDRHAVRVDVAGQTVGYLEREMAAVYQPPLLALRDQAKVGWCPARIMGDGHRPYGVYLHLGIADMLCTVNSTDGLEMLDPEKSVTVTRKEDHQDVLGRYGRDAPTLVAVSLALCTVAKGKHVGSSTLEVRVDGERVGELTKAMGDRYLPIVAPLLERGVAPGAEGIIGPTVKGWQVEIRLPG